MLVSCLSRAFPFMHAFSSAFKIQKRHTLLATGDTSSFFKLQVIKNQSATWQRNQYVVVRLLNDFFFKDSMLFASQTGCWGMWNFGLGVLVLFSWIPKSGSSAKQRREIFSCFHLLDTKTCLATTTSWTWCPSHVVICYCTSLWLLFQILQYFILFYCGAGLNNLCFLLVALFDVV